MDVLGEERGDMVQWWNDVTMQGVWYLVARSMTTPSFHVGVVLGLQTLFSTPMISQPTTLLPS